MLELDEEIPLVTAWRFVPRYRHIHQLSRGKKISLARQRGKPGALQHATQLVSAGDPTVANVVEAFDPNVLGDYWASLIQKRSAALTEPIWLKPDVVIKSWKRTGLPQAHPPACRAGVRQLRWRHYSHAQGWQAFPVSAALSCSSQLAADIVAHAVRVERDICGGEEGVEVVNEPPLKLLYVWTICMNHTRCTRPALRAPQKTLKRKTGEEDSSEPHSSLQRPRMRE
jgi:hypothetical protein